MIQKRVLPISKKRKSFMEDFFIIFSSIHFQVVWRRNKLEVEIEEYQSQKNTPIHEVIRL